MDEEGSDDEEQEEEDKDEDEEQEEFGDDDVENEDWLWPELFSCFSSCPPKRLHKSTK